MGTGAASAPYLILIDDVRQAVIAEHRPGLLFDDVATRPGVVISSLDQQPLRAGAGAGPGTAVRCLSPGALKHEAAVQLLAV